MKYAVAAGANFDKTPIHVRHRDLERSTQDSPFRSYCPVCGGGVLLVHRHNDGQLNRADRCTLCGQEFFYEDPDIAGLALVPSLGELDALAQSDDQRKPDPKAN